MLSGGESISVVHAPPVLRSAVPPPADDGRRTTDDGRRTTDDQGPQASDHPILTHHPLLRRRRFVAAPFPRPPITRETSTGRHVTSRCVCVVPPDARTNSSELSGTTRQLSGPRRSEHTNDWSFRPTGSFQTILLFHIVHCRHTVIPHPSTRPSRRTNGRIQRGNSTSWNPFPGS